MPETDPKSLLRTLLELRQSIDLEGRQLFENWRDRLVRQSCLQSALNLAHYLALRHHDLRPFQQALMTWGLSSLGRCESRVLPNLDAVLASLGAIARIDPDTLPTHPTEREFFQGERLLARHTEELLGQTQERWVRIMVTLPEEAAENDGFLREILQRGTNCVRINCAKDDAATWQRMVDNLRRAERETGYSCKLLMDLGGIQPRTEEVVAPDPDRRRLYPGDRLLLTRSRPEPSGEFEFQASCTLPELLDQVEVGQSVWIDDGKLGTRVIDKDERGIILETIHARPDKGEKLKTHKGMNFPETQIQFQSLTNKDLKDLDFIAETADLVGHSFVQTADDVVDLQRELRSRTSRTLGIIAKIETAQGVHNLPSIIVQGAGMQPFGVMVARGDLAVEIGYERLAEMQEELLWICEAAHVPVIWATDVLHRSAKKGAPSRAEMTDAAMAERAECVMLNKGPFIAETVSMLDNVLTRMQAHQRKKTPLLRALRAWI